MFAYCNNNPTIHSDPKGTFVNTITGALVGGIIGGISAWMSGDDIWAGIGVGAVTGAVAGAAASSVTEGLINGDDAKTIAKNTVVSVGTSVAVDGVFSGMGKIAKNAVRGKYRQLGTFGKMVKRATYEPKYLNTKSVSTITSNMTKDFLVGLPVDIALRFANKAY